jgi:hypothetical protein
MERRSLKSKVGDRICTPPWRTLSQCRPVVSYASMLCPSGAQTHTRYTALERGIKGTQRLRGRRRYMHASLRAWKGKNGSCMIPSHFIHNTLRVCAQHN